MKMKNYIFRKGLVVSIILLFVGASIVSGINVNFSDYNGIQTIRSYGDVESKNNTVLTFHTFDDSGTQQHDLTLSDGDAKYIFDVLEELKYKIVYEPRSEETQELKIEFVDLLDAYGLIPEGLSKEDVLSMLNPSWLNNKQKTTEVRTRTLLLRSFTSRIIEKIVNLQQIFKNRFGKTNPSIVDNNPLIFSSGSEVGTATFCSIASGGEGATLPLFLLPRPRGAAVWSASLAVTLVGELLTGKGFTAGGAQSGTALGFMGLGLTYAFPGYTMYGFVGYALYTKVNAEFIEYFEPPNQAPVISDENPANGGKDIHLSLSELSFRISDADGDQMDYTVTTEPNIGSGSGNNKQGGVYTVPVSGLEYDKVYRWTVEVTDDKDTTIKQFDFFTLSGPPFDPFNEGWQYRKKITIDHEQVAGDLTSFPVLISTIDADLRDKAQDDGDDILFMDDIGVSNKLSHEIEYFDDSSGELVAWVNIPSLSGSTDTLLYMYYGNPSCSSQQNVAGTWDSNYCGVWHLTDSYDSTQNDNDGTIYGAIWTTGISGGALDFDGIDDYIDCLYAGPSGGTPRTITAWATTTQTSVQMILSYGGSDFSAGSTFRVGLPAWNYVEGAGIDVSYGAVIYDVNTDDGWHFYAFIVPDISDPKLEDCIVYQDNNILTEIAISDLIDQSIYTSSSNPIDIGRSFTQEDKYFNGIIDEVRISDIARNQQWISTEYNNQNDPSSFLSFGPEET